MGLRRGVVLRAAVLAAVLGFAAAGFISSRSHSVTALPIWFWVRGLIYTKATAVSPWTQMTRCWSAGTTPPAGACCRPRKVSLRCHLSPRSVPGRPFDLRASARERLIPPLQIAP